MQTPPHLRRDFLATVGTGTGTEEAHVVKEILA